MKGLKLLLILFVVTSCNREEMSIPRIEQIVQMSVKDASGNDLLDTDNENAYKIQLFDLRDVYDRTPVSAFTIKEGASGNYLEYTAGAKRILLDSISPAQKTYLSEMAVVYSRIAGTQTVSSTDTLAIEYSWTPELFTVSEVRYNKISQQVEKDSAVHRFTIIK